MSDEKREPTSTVVTKTSSHAQASFSLPTERGIAPYRDPSVGITADRTHAQELSEQRARRMLGLASAAIALIALLSLPRALAESTFTAGLVAIIGAGAAWLGALALRAYARERNASVAIYEREIVIATGASRETVPWDAIVEVRADLRADRTQTLRAVALTSLTLVDGRVVHVPRAISGASSLALEVFSRTRDALVRATRDALDRGGRVLLGPIVLPRNGIIAGDHLWGWEALPRVRVDGPFLHVFALFDPTPPSTVLIEDVANLHVVFDLLSSGYAPPSPSSSTPTQEPPPATEGQRDEPQTHNTTEKEPS
jgi:hypothetical protein